MLPVVRESYEWTASLLARSNEHCINIDPELMASLAAYKFVQKLTREYKNRTNRPNESMYPNKKIAMCRTVPHNVVMETIQKMTILTLGH